jgi:GNAT superfamily N-acetyltransferase
MKRWHGCLGLISQPMRIESGDGTAVPHRRRNFIGAAVRNALGRRLQDPARAVENGVAPIQIRRYCPDSDLAACAEIYYRTRRETFAWLPRSRFRRSDFLVDTFEEELFVAEQDGKVIAFAGVYAPDDFLHHLYVAGEHQGHGAGSALLRYLLDRSEGRLRLKCLCRNERALAFYRGRGWREGDHGWDTFGQWVMLHGPVPVAPP